jgi:hypothetical protein
VRRTAAIAEAAAKIRASNTVRRFLRVEPRVEPIIHLTPKLKKGCAALR